MALNCKGKNYRSNSAGVDEYDKILKLEKENRSHLNNRYASRIQTYPSYQCLRRRYNLARDDTQRNIFLFFKNLSCSTPRILWYFTHASSLPSMFIYIWAKCQILFCSCYRHNLSQMSKKLNEYLETLYAWFSERNQKLSTERSRFYRKAECSTESAKIS